MLNLQAVASVVCVLVLLSPIVYRLATFTWFHFLRPSTVHHYLHGKPAYALVTGASDGIGKALALELYERGFNLIIHGHKADEVHQIADEIRSRGPRDVRYFIADATQSGHDFARLLKPFRDLNITVVIHNVGGSWLDRERIDKAPESRITGTLNWTAMFAVYLTRALLPQLRLSAIDGPVMMQFIGTTVTDASPPRLPVYCASKAFLRALARGLDNDEREGGAPTDVSFAYLSVGDVNTKANPCEETIFSPSPEQVAKSIVSKIGCGRKAYAPYMPHAVIEWMLSVLPESTVDAFMADTMAEKLSRNRKKL